MSKLLMAALGCLMFATGVALAQPGQAVPQKKEGTAAQKKQQERQNACNARADSKGLTNSARKDFVTACLKGDPAYGPKK
jgi:hypothetical protein